MNLRKQDSIELWTACSGSAHAQCLSWHCCRGLPCLPTHTGLLPGALGAVFRTVLETMRTLFVWLVDLLLFYTPLGFGTLGESWSRWSFVQAGG